MKTCELVIEILSFFMNYLSIVWAISCYFIPPSSPLPPPPPLPLRRLRSCPGWEGRAVAAEGAAVEGRRGRAGGGEGWAAGAGRERSKEASSLHLTHISWSQFLKKQIVQLTVRNSTQLCPPAAF